MSILLAYSSGIATPDDTTTFTDLLPIGLCSLHALLRSRGHQAILANLSGMPPAKVQQLFRRLNPRVVGLSQWTHNRHATLELAQLAKQLLPDCLVVLGGGHATHQAESLLEHHPEVDLIVSGEGELTLLELLSALDEQRPLASVAGLVMRDGPKPVRTSPRARISDLDQLPFACQYLHEAIGVNLELQTQFISTSRGCPSACRFCASPRFWGRVVRTRSPVSVAEEFLFQRRSFGTIYLSLRDDTFTADRSRTIALCQELLRQRVQMFWNCQTRVEAVDEEVVTWMKRAGCECVQLGVESGSPRVLEQLGKRITTEQVLQACDAIHRVGLQLSVYLISGIPGETPADRQATHKLLQRIRPHDVQVAPLAYYPGTALYGAALRHQTLPAHLFESDRSEALLVEPDGMRRASELMRSASRLAPTLSSQHITAIKQRIGYCAVTAMQAGDHYLQRGDWQQAADEYRAIVTNEPDHPWGWLLLAELYEQVGQTVQANDCYRRLLALVPRHPQALLHSTGH